MTDAQQSGKSLADLPPPKPSAPDPSFIPCPHCGRRFSVLAGERHIPHCKNIKAKVRSFSAFKSVFICAGFARLAVVQFSTRVVSALVRSFDSCEGGDHPM